MPHRINLKGPWDYAPVSSAPAGSVQPLPPGGTAKFPQTWQELFGDFHGTARFTRHFNRPTNLEPTDRVELVFEGIGGVAVVNLNRQTVGSVQQDDQPVRIDITATLLPHNVLEISIDWHSHGDRPGGLWAPVALEIV